MSRNIIPIPFTEIVERAQELSRSSKNTKKKTRGITNDIYLRDMSSKSDWNFMLAESSLTTLERYNTGTASIDTGGTTVTFSSDFVADSGMVGQKIKIGGNDVVYNITGISGGSVTLLESFEGSRNAASDAFNIYQDQYPVAGNFDRFPKDGGFFKWVGGKKEIKPEWSVQENMEDSTASPGEVGNIRLVGRNSGGDQLIELDPPPLNRRQYGYRYFRFPTPLFETTAGTLENVGASATTVTGDTNCRFNDATTGDFFRVDNFGTGDDSSWYRIISITHDSSLTLQTAFANTAVTTANFTISRAPDIPERMHPAVLYGTVMGLAVDQNDPNALFYRGKYAEIMSDSKRIYVSRVYSQEVEGIYEDWNYRR